MRGYTLEEGTNICLLISKGKFLVSEFVSNTSTYCSPNELVIRLSAWLSESSFGEQYVDELDFSGSDFRGQDMGLVAKTLRELCPDLSAVTLGGMPSRAHQARNESFTEVVEVLQILADPVDGNGHKIDGCLAKVGVAKMGMGDAAVAKLCKMLRKSSSSIQSLDLRCCQCTPCPFKLCSCIHICVCSLVLAAATSWHPLRECWTHSPCSSPLLLTALTPSKSPAVT
jgi:hypothetical protein